MNPDQTVTKGVVLSGSILFAKEATNFIYIQMIKQTTMRMTGKGSTPGRDII